MFFVEFIRVRSALALLFLIIYAPLLLPGPAASESTGRGDFGAALDAVVCGTAIVCAGLEVVIER
ncbi:hypothetical protein XI06_13365 [Bradyrhizobium sp. CCBAU 11434]|nr:hypothetical protein [Bradyrhizobium sp. CCBAU 11434]